jgi:hypothetical protein
MKKQEKNMIKDNIINIVYARTSHNRTVYASPPVGGSGYRKTQSGYALCAVFFRHIFAVAGNLRFPLSQPQKRHIQPERYAKLRLNVFENII